MPVTSRRAVLGTVFGTVLGGVSAAVTGCTGTPGPAPSPTPHPLAPTLAGIVALVDRYEATIAAYPDLSDRLQPLLAEHQTHASAVRRAMGTPEPSASAADSASPTASVAPGDPAGAVAALRKAEQAGQADATTACLAAPADFAALIGSIAACRATHVEVLA